MQSNNTHDQIELIKIRAPIWICAFGGLLGIVALFAPIDAERVDRCLDLARDLILVGGGCLGAGGGAAAMLSKSRETNTTTVQQNFNRSNQPVQRKLSQDYEDDLP